MKRYIVDERHLRNFLVSESMCLGYARERAEREADMIMKRSEYPEFKERERAEFMIDQGYIPRPCLQDGEPIMHGLWYEGESDGKHWMAIGFGEGKYDVFGKNQYGSIKPLKSKWLRRIHPKVYDADGVEIKVGDTVWFANKNLNRFKEKPATVREVDERGVNLSCDGSHVWYGGDCFTHSEPDSLEKLRDDITAWTEKNDHYRAHTGKITDLWASRLTALMKRDAQ